LHLVGSSVLLYLIDDARSNKNQMKTNTLNVKLAHKYTLPILYSV